MKLHASHQRSIPAILTHIVVAALLAGACLNSPRAAQSQAMSQAAANKEIVQRFLEAIPARDAPVMHSLLAPDARLVLMVAGVYSPELMAFPRGTQWGREPLIDAEIDFQKNFLGRFTLQVLSLIAQDNEVAAEAVGHGVRAQTGRPYLQHYSYHFRMSRGRIASIHLYQDTFHLWDVWDNMGPPAQAPYPLTISPTAIAAGKRTLQTSAQRAGVCQVDTNKEIARRFLTGVPAQDPQITRATWAPEGIWSFAVGGDYSPALHAFERAPRWDREAMITMQHDGQKTLKEPLTLDIYSLIGEGNDVSAEAVGFMVRPDGRAYRQHYSFHFKAREGKLIEGHVYQDTLHQYDLALEHATYAPVVPPTAR